MHGQCAEECRRQRRPTCSTSMPTAPRRRWATRTKPRRSSWPSAMPPRTLVVNSTKSMTGHLLGGAGGRRIGVHRAGGASSDFAADHQHLRAGSGVRSRLLRQHGAANEDRCRAEEQLRLWRHQRFTGLQARLIRHLAITNGKERVQFPINHRTAPFALSGWGDPCSQRHRSCMIALVPSDAAGFGHARLRYRCLWRCLAVTGIDAADPDLAHRQRRKYPVPHGRPLGFVVQVRPLTGSATAHPWLTVLLWLMSGTACRSGHRARFSRADEFRRLRVWLRWRLEVSDGRDGV